MLRRTIMLSACVAAAAFVAPATQRTTPLAASNDFENPNPILKQALDAVPTIQEGRTMVLVAASEEAAPPPADEQRRRRAQAAEKLQNIDGAERQRRLQAGRVLAVVTLAQSAYPRPRRNIPSPPPRNIHVAAAASPRPASAGGRPPRNDGSTSQVPLREPRGAHHAAVAAAVPVPVAGALRERAGGLVKHRPVGSLGRRRGRAEHPGAAATPRDAERLRETPRRRCDAAAAMTWRVRRGDAAVASPPRL